MKKPKIRFKGFTDDWEQRKFGDVAEIRRGLTYKPDDVKESGIRVLRSSNINEGYFETYKDDILVDEVAVNIPYVKNGDIIITSANGSSRLVGKHAIIKNIPDNSMVHGGFMLVASTNQPEFLNSSMNSPWYAKFINTYVVGGNGAIGNLSKSDLDNQEITVPSLEEQKEIGQYFSTLDKLVTLHQRECEQLKTFKKYMLQNMFPENGEKVPKIRFKGFTDDWEQRKFGDLGSVAMCKRIFKEQTSAEGEVPFYKIGTFGGMPDAFISRELFDEYKSKYQYPEIGDMLISASGTIGRIVEYTGEDAYFQDSNIVWFKHDDRIENSFLKCIYNTVKWDGIEGSTIKRLYNDNFLKTSFAVPAVSEQEKIGSYFSTLDNLITLHQCKCEQLKKFKKYMLQNMFI